MARPRTNIPLRYFYRRQPMLMVEKSIACQTRWVTSSMPPNASYVRTYVVLALDKMAEEMHKGIFYE